MFELVDYNDIHFYFGQSPDSHTSLYIRSYLLSYLQDPQMVMSMGIGDSSKNVRFCPWYCLECVQMMRNLSPCGVDE